MEYTDILDRIKLIGRVPNYPLDFQNFLKNQRFFSNFKSYSISSSLNLGIGDAFSLDIVDQTISMITGEIKSVVYKDTLLQLSTSSDFEYMDIRMDHMRVNKIEEFLSNKNFRYIITNAMLGSEIQDSRYYSTLDHKKVYGNGEVYPIGRIFDIDVYVDPYMRFDDTRMILCDNCFYNFSDFSGHIVSENNFTPRLLVEFGCEIKVSNSKILYVICDESTMYLERAKYYLIQKNRENQINKII